MRTLKIATLVILSPVLFIFGVLAYSVITVSMGSVRLLNGAKHYE